MQAFYSMQQRGEIIRSHEIGDITEEERIRLLKLLPQIVGCEGCGQ